MKFFEHDSLFYSILFLFEKGGLIKVQVFTENKGSYQIIFTMWCGCINKLLTSIDIISD